MSKLYGIYGASGFGREVMPLARKVLADLRDDSELVFVDDGDFNEVLNGHRVLSFDEFLDVDIHEKHMCLAIANGVIREKLFKKLSLNNIVHWSVTAKNAISMDEVEVGNNCILAPFVTLTSNIVVGKAFHANLYSYVAHDCVIGDFVTFAPGVKCNGNVVIEDHAYIGTGAIIKQGQPGKPIVIGKGSVVGMGAVVTKSIPAGVTVIGNPARPLML